MVSCWASRATTCCGVYSANDSTCPSTILLDDAGTALPTLAAGGPLEDLARTEAIESLRRAVLALPERYREVVVLCDLQELSYAETAEVIGCAVGTVRSRLHRARALLIAKLRPANEEQPSTAEMNSTRCFA